MVSVIASSVRKGNVIEKEGKLYLVLTAENIHPGKGTPVTHLEMRRISDGVKTVWHEPHIFELRKCSPYLGVNPRLCSIGVVITC